QITSATGQAEQVAFMVSLGCENGSLNSSIFYPRLTYFPTSPRRENAPLRTLNTEEPLMVVVDSLDEYHELLAPGGGVAQGSYACAPDVETRAGHTQLGAHPGDRVIDPLRINQRCLLR